MSASTQQVVERLSTMCFTATCAEPTSPGVWWRDDADWKQYDAVQAAAIQKAAAAGASKVELGSVFSSKYAGGVRYVVDLATMTQTNIASGFERDVKIVKPRAPTETSAAAAAPVDETVMKELAACKKTILSLKNMVLKLNVDVMALKLQLAKNKAKQFGAQGVRCDVREDYFAQAHGVNKCGLLYVYSDDESDYD